MASLINNQTNIFTPKKAQNQLQININNHNQNNNLSLKQQILYQKLLYIQAIKQKRLMIQIRKKQNSFLQRQIANIHFKTQQHCQKSNNYHSQIIQLSKANLILKQTYKNDQKQYINQQNKSIQIQTTLNNKINQIKIVNNVLTQKITVKKTQNNKTEANLQNQIRISNNKQKQIKYYQQKKTKIIQHKSKNNQQQKKIIIENKKVNQIVQQARGNIRVYCRIRPFINQQSSQIIHQVKENILKIKIPQKNLRSANNQSNYSFVFEKIFDMQQTQQSVFEELATLVECSMQGNNVCIFAYGQTGSGKTHTMQGGGDKENEGIIPRSVSLIFRQIQQQKKSGWEYNVYLSIQQIYLDQVRNLIQTQNKKTGKPHDFDVKSDSEVRLLIENAQKARKTASTKCNADSSRSHLIFTLMISGKLGNVIKQGTLVIVDLAGSERINESQVEGIHRKEAIAINSSLSSLGKVINSLNQKQKQKGKQIHIPYRDSKLTQFLQEYLSKKSKVLMFVNMSPNERDLAQTINSLRFAQKVQDTKTKK